MLKKWLNFMWLKYVLLALIFGLASAVFWREANVPKAEAQACKQVYLVRCTGNGCIPNCPGGFTGSGIALVGFVPGGYYGFQESNAQLCWQN